jgi:predicted kinase
MFPESADTTVTVIFVFGVNAVGKSSFSRELAGHLPRCAFIEVDELRYKVIGGLVAHSRGMCPDHAPAEFARQYEMACKNAVLLASGFADYGFSSVIDGLEEKYAGRKLWLTSQIPSARLITVGLFCDPYVLQDRRAQRGWLPNLPDRIEQKLIWYRTNEGGFDFVVDTGRDDIDSLAPILQLAALPLSDRT